MQYPELYKNGKLIKPEKSQETALKMTQKLATPNYRDNGFLINATNEERNKIMAHAMHYQLGVKLGERVKLNKSKNNDKNKNNLSDKHHQYHD